MLAKISLILGGASSGKSAFAEQMVKETGSPKVYLATAQAYDPEMQAKIAAHLVMRGENWATIEEPLALKSTLESLSENHVVLLDCATMWLSNHLLAASDIEREVTELLSSLDKCKARVVIVSNEVGMGIVPDNALARQFRDEQGKLNQKLAQSADLVAFVIAGLPQVLKGKLP
ncbi:bifunctional adenosylcobinamide kinase/adenosylcobinamide-phosphate guanylyltransferase [Cognatishimia sp. WU-CL00825]|uniref:bifunctional adenosylcobinamide kinase/adenosylcobinamide-phosphate guanylyltransferase n=1 Tax=Cognatishimia sp. WU-CL00825 TaxID=3127658 RepID=UPI003103B3FE